VRFQKICPKKTQIGLVAIFLALVLVELALRLGLGDRPPDSSRLYTVTTIPGLYWRQRPHAKMDFSFISKIIKTDPVHKRMLAEYVLGTYAINALGFRDRDYDLASLQNKEVILCLGDSTTFGTDVLIQNTYAKQLEALLQKEGREDVIVINAGTGGYNLAQYRSYLDYLMPRLHPQIVTVGLCLNDNIPVTWRSITYHLASDMGQHSLLAYNLFMGLIAARTELAQQKQAYLNQARQVLDPDSMASVMRYAETLDAPHQRDLFESVAEINQMNLWQQTFPNFIAMKTLCDTNHVPLICLIFPNSYQLQPGYYNLEPQKTITAYLRGQKITYCDMTPIFRSAMEHGQVCYFKHYNFDYFNALGHGLVAKCIDHKIAEIQKYDNPTH
jgi:hypothetical protein